MIVTLFFVCISGTSPNCPENVFHITGSECNTLDGAFLYRSRTVPCGYLGGNVCVQVLWFCFPYLCFILFLESLSQQVLLHKPKTKTQHGKCAPTVPLCARAWLLYLKVLFVYTPYAPRGREPRICGRMSVGVVVQYLHGDSMSTYAFVATGEHKI